METLASIRSFKTRNLRENERMEMSYKQMVRWLLGFSVVALLLAPVIMMMGAFSASALFIGSFLLIMGALGLYAGMKAFNKEDQANQQ